MAISNFGFTPTDGLRNVASFPTVPATEADARNQPQSLMDQIRDYINNTVIPEINSKLAQSGGNLTGALTANNTITATALIASGLTGATGASRYVGATASGAPTSGTFAEGDFVLDRSGNIWICITAGTPGTWKSSSPTGPVSSFRAYQSTAQSIPASNVYTKVAFQTEDYDNLNEYDTSNFRFTAQSPGIYAVTAALRWNGMSSGTGYTLALYKNGVNYCYLNMFANNTSANSQGAVHIKLNAGDYLEIYAAQTAASAANVWNQSESTFFEVVKVA